MNKLLGYRKRKFAELTTRRNLLDSDLDEILSSRFPFYNDFLPYQKKDFNRKVLIFIKCKEFIGMDGFRITKFHKIIISALAVRLIFRLGLKYYDHINNIYVFEREFEITENVNPLSGITHSSGLIGLSWNAIYEGISNSIDCKCIVSHEFAHALDLYDNNFDGLPRIYKSQVIKPLIISILREHEDFIGYWEEWHRIIYKHKVKDVAEFFATITEIYFENSEFLKKNNEKLFKIFRKIYKYEPTPNNMYKQCRAI